MASSLVASCDLRILSRASVKGIKKTMAVGDDSSVPDWLKKFSFLKQNSISRTDMFLLGITGIITGQIGSWNDAAEGRNFKEFIASAIFPTIGYIILTCCVAEMASALPFSGGIYGFVRAFTTPVVGFFVAVFEMMLNVFYVSPAVYQLASLPVQLGSMSSSSILLNCFIIYVVVLFIVLLGGRIFWIVNNGIGCLVLVLFLSYIIGSCSVADYDKWGRGSDINTFDPLAFMEHIPVISTCFLGMQIIPLTARCARDPKKDVPIVMITVITVCVLITFGLFMTAFSQYPGIDNLFQIDYPLNFGYSRIFNISINAAAWLNVPFLFATVFAFTFFSGRQGACMAKSGLIPDIFQHEIPFLETPYVSLITFSFVSFMLNIALFYNDHLIDDYSLVASLSSFVVYVATLISYIAFHRKYSSLDRYFYSPFGKIGAFLGILIFAFCFVGGVAFQEEPTAAIILAVVGGFALIYNVFFMKEHVFSEEEKKELFKAYLVNANAATKKRMKKRGKVAPSLANSKSKASDAASRSVGSRLDSEYNTEDKSSPEELNGEKELEDTNTKSNQLSAVEPVHNSPPPPPALKHAACSAKLEGSKKGLSEKLIQFISSKMNEVLPDPEYNKEVQELEILQAGGSYKDCTSDNNNNDAVAVVTKNGVEMV